MRTALSAMKKEYEAAKQGNRSHNSAGIPGSFYFGHGLEIIFLMTLIQNRAYTKAAGHGSRAV
jgi:hypothetical protein